MSLAHYLSTMFGVVPTNPPASDPPAPATPTDPSTPQARIDAVLVALDNARGLLRYARRELENLGLDAAAHYTMVAAMTTDDATHAIEDAIP